MDFPSLQKQLEHEAAHLIAAQEQSQHSRQKLVNLTMKFCTSASPDVKKAVSSILKCFQAEVDSLTTRSKFTEDAFFSIYKKLMDMPDPTLALNEVNVLLKKSQHCQDLELENRKLRETVDEMRSEVALNKKNEQRVKKLQIEINQLNEGSSGKITEAILRKQKELAEQFENREGDMTTAMLAANKKAKEAELKMATMQQALEATHSELFELKMRTDESKAGKQDELSILLAELETSNERIMQLEREVGSSEPPESQLQISQEAETIRLQARVDDLDSELNKKSNELANLSGMLSALQEESKNKESEHGALLRRLEEEVYAANQASAVLTEELSKMSDYDDLRKQLTILRAIEFPEASDVQVETLDTYEQPLEVLLRHKNVDLQNKLARLSSEKEQLAIDLVGMKEKDNELSDKVEQQKLLISKLEDDLNQASSWVCSDPSQQHPGSPPPLSLVPWDGRQEAQLLASAIEGPNTQPSSTMVDATSTSLLAIVQSQRDRFRAQTRDMENSVLSTRQQMIAIQSELESVREDNVKLYEKIKFLQNYNQHQRTVPKPVPSTSSSVHISVDMPEKEPSMAKYSTAYEAQLNPFEQFGLHERMRHYRNLQPYEKLLLKLGHLITQSRRGRFAACMYALALHLLVFLVLYKLALSSDNICRNKFADHMEKFHH